MAQTEILLAIGARGSSPWCFKTKISKPPQKHCSYHTILLIDSAVKRQRNKRGKHIVKRIRARELNKSTFSMQNYVPGMKQGQEGERYMGKLNSCAPCLVQHIPPPAMQYTQQKAFPLYMMTLIDDDK